MQISWRFKVFSSILFFFYVMLFDDVVVKRKYSRISWIFGLLSFFFLAPQRRYSPEFEHLKANFISLIVTITMICHYLCFFLVRRFFVESLNQNHTWVYFLSLELWLYRFDSNQIPNCVYYCMFFSSSFRQWNKFVGAVFFFFFCCFRIFFLLAFHPTRRTRLFSIYFVFSFCLSSNSPR